MTLVRERAIYVDMSRREEGIITFAIDRNYLTMIKKDIERLDGISIESIDE